LRSVALALCFALSVACGARAQDAAQSGANQQSWCYADATNLLTRKWPSDCKSPSRIVSDAEAKDIQAARQKRVQGAFAPKKVLFQGKRMIGSGSGMVVLADGHVLTNNHVIDHCDAFSIIPAAGSEVAANLLAADPAHDLALLRAELPGHGVAKFRETIPPPATDIAVIGYPNLGRVAIKPIFVEGTVYAGGPPGMGRSDRFAINMDVRHGNSGGPTVDRFGSVVGVVVAKINTPAVYANTGQVVFELGFSIRSDVALSFMRANGVAPAIGGESAELPNDKLLEFVSRYVAQIGCWK